MELSDKHAKDNKSVKYDEWEKRLREFTKKQQGHPDYEKCITCFMSLMDKEEELKRVQEHLEQEIENLDKMDKEK